MKAFLHFRRLFLFSGLLIMAAPGAPAADIKDWYRFSIQEDRLSPVTDFSGLNHALTGADRIYARDAHFFRVGPDGKRGGKDDQRIRLFGINLSGSANFPSEEDAPRIARRLRSLGFNAVRLHQLDAQLSDDEDHPKGILSSGAFPSFNAGAIRRLRFFIDELKKEGIYVNLNLHVAYRFRYEVDQVAPLLDGQKMPPASHPLHLFEPRMIALQGEYAQQLIRRLELNNEPALAMIELNNESSLVGAWQRTDLDQLKGEYERLLQQQWQRWILRRYGSLQQACEGWQSCHLPRQGSLLVKVDEAQILNYGEGNLAQVKRWLKKGFSKAGWKTPAMLDPDFRNDQRGPRRRVLDFVAFLTEADKQYLDTLRKTVRAEVGDMVPLTGTQIYYGGAANFDSQQDFDYVDEHFYVDHYDFPHQPWDSNDWRIRNQSALREAWEPLLRQAYLRDWRKPFVMSEFNQPYPNQQSAEILPVMAAIASAQDWDGLFFFHYVDGDTWKTLPDSFSLSGHTGQLVTTGTSAAMFRQFQIPPLRDTLLVPLPQPVRELLAGMRDGVASNAYADYLNNCCKLSAREAFSYRVGVDVKALVGSELQHTPSGADESVWRARNGVLLYDAQGPHLQAQGRYVSLFAGYGDASAATNVDGTDNYLSPHFAANGSGGASGRSFGVMMLTPRDAKPLAQSRHLLLTVSGATLGSQPGAIPERPKKMVDYPGGGNWQTLEPDLLSASKPSGPREASGPVWLEKMSVTLFLPVKARKIIVYPLTENGQRMTPLPPQQIRAQAQGFSLELHEPSPWYEILVIG